jgi:transposase-like protein
MSRNSKFSLEDRLEIVKRVQSGKISAYKLGMDLGISETQVSTWVNFYKKYGVEGLMLRKSNSSYSIETKVAAIDY